MDKESPDIFRLSSDEWEIDTCEPLKKASKEGHLTYLAYGHKSYPGDKFPNGTLPEISNIGFWDSAKEQDWGLDWHRNEGVEFTFVSHGTVSFNTSNQTRDLHAGVLAITPPWVKHKLGNPTVGASKLFWIILDVQVRRPNQKWVWPEWILLNNEEQARLEELIHSKDFTIPVSQTILKTIEQLQEMVEHQRILTHPTHLKIVINQLCVDLLSHDQLDHYDVPENTAKNQISQTIDIFLQELPNYLKTPWNVDLMASECGMGKTIFSKVIKQKTNKSPMQHLNDLRLSTASSMLHQETYLVKEIAEELGYNTTDYFCKCFKKKFGLSPGQHAETVTKE